MGYAHLVEGNHMSIIGKFKKFLSGPSFVLSDSGADALAAGCLRAAKLHPAQPRRMRLVGGRKDHPRFERVAA